MDLVLAVLGLCCHPPTFSSCRVGAPLCCGGRALDVVVSVVAEHRLQGVQASAAVVQ